MASSTGKYGRPRGKVVCLLVISVVGVMLGCGTKTQLLRESSALVRPGWAEQPPPPDSSFSYFVGLASGAETLESGREAATNGALAKIANFLGTKVESAFEEQSTHIEQQLRQRITSAAAARVLGAEIVDSYHEKIIRIDGNVRREKFDVWVLARYPRNQAEQERRRQEQANREKALSAYDLYVKGQAAEDQRRFDNATHSYDQALVLMTQVDGVVSIEHGAVRTSEELRALVETRRREALARLRRLSVAVRVAGPDRSLDTFYAALADALAQRDFRVGSDDPTVEITGEVAIRQGGAVFDATASYAEGSITARRLADGEIIAVVPVRAKGFHRIPERAALSALHDAGREAGERLARLLLEQESR